MPCVAPLHAVLVLRSVESNTPRPDTQNSQMSSDTTRSTLEEYAAGLVFSCGKTRCRLSSVVHGFGEMDLYRRHMRQMAEASNPSQTARNYLLDLDFEDHPYLIVDLRDIDEFNANHIVSGSFVRCRSSVPCMFLSTSSASLSSHDALALFQQRIQRAAPLCNPCSSLVLLSSRCADANRKAHVTINKKTLLGKQSRVERGQLVDGHSYYGGGWCG